MALVNLNVRDLGYQVMYPEYLRVVWHLSDTARNAAGQVISKRPKEFIPDSNGNVSCYVVDTETMLDDQYYTITLEYLDAVGGMSQLESPDWQIRVPSGTSSLVSLISNYRNPLLTWVGETYPDPITAFWLNPTTGAFYGLDR